MTISFFVLSFTKQYASWIRAMASFGLYLSLLLKGPIRFYQSMHIVLIRRKITIQSRQTANYSSY